MKKSVKILIIMLCLIIVGLLTFIMVDKVINTKKEEKSNNESNNVIVEENNIKRVEENNTTSTSNVKRDEQIPTSNNNENKNSSNIANEAIKKSLYADEYVKIIDQALSKNGNEIKCDLIYFNDDNIPDLVIDDGSLSLYMYENGTVYNPIDKESYGIGGCKYFDYYEKKGVISNFGTSLAGALCGENFFVLNSKNEIEDMFSYTVEGAEPEDEEMKKQFKEELNKYGGYYYKGQKITEEEFKSKLKDYGIEFSTEELWNSKSSIKKALVGTKSPEDIKIQLGK